MEEVVMEEEVVAVVVEVEGEDEQKEEEEQRETEDGLEKGSCAWRASAALLFPSPGRHHPSPLLAATTPPLHSRRRPARRMLPGSPEGQCEVLDLIIERSVGIDRTLDALSEAFDIKGLVGEGRFAQVKGGTRLSDGLPVALKGVLLEALEEDEETLEVLEAEVAALRLVSARAELQRNVVRLHEIVKVRGDSLYMVMGLVPGAELFELVDKHGAMPMGLVRLLMAQLLSALEVLHNSLGLVHRDVKPENLMVHGLHSKESARVVLIDFGYAVKASGADAIRGVAGSPEYAAPEVLSWLKPGGQGTPYGAACDIWSVGVTAYVLLAASMPLALPDDTTEESLAAATSAALARGVHYPPETFPSPCRVFIASCLQLSAEARPGASQLAAHAWLTREPAEAWAAWPPPPAGGAGRRQPSARELLSMLKLSPARPRRGGREGGRPSPLLHQLRHSSSRLRQAWFVRTGAGRGGGEEAAEEAEGKARRRDGRSRGASEAGDAGVAMLKQGSKAMKYSRRGKPHVCLFKLSEDERVLSWEPSTGRSVLKRAVHRSINLADVVHVEVGFSTEVMKRHSDEANCHLALSLVLNASPPADDAADDAERGTLDLVCLEEEQFGLWLTALRELTASSIEEKPPATPPAGGEPSASEG
ncbi:hypothetical protein AB1Y20_014280 [Prymnesium parvum]|uniref:Protein kinase domain-containing protein n=1 Tax=Prymnesium parvum TaxID=97485 RepID=A0AB34IFU7_PRYPA